MGDGDGGGEARYRAFVSYSHRDQAFGRRLHRRLERYPVPRRLVGRLTARGTVPTRVAPVFRDREEFSAAHDLTAEIRAALAASEALVVVCSPNAAASPWVAREIELFRELHPDRPVLAALAEGEPAEAFPAALTAAAAEPLAADFRRQGDGPRLALLKLVAGILGLGLDELVQRDAQRRLASVTAVTAGAVAVALAMSALTTFALLARAEAQRQRAEAEALVEFMLTDLRDRLKGVGRLDVLGSVNERALAYYQKQAAQDLPAESLERRARVLHAMGEDDINRGALASAARELAEAERATGALLAAEPRSTDRMLAHAQSRYWTGYVHYKQGRREAARRAWSDYQVLARRLVAQEPDERKHLLEAGFADGNVCTLALMDPPDVTAALEACASALRWVQAAARRSASPTELGRQLANRHGWMAEAFKAANRNEEAMRERRAAEAILIQLMRVEPRAMDLKQQWIAMQRSMSGLDFRAGRQERARERLQQALASLDEMIAFEPANEEWRRQRARILSNLEYIDNARSKGAGT